MPDLATPQCQAQCPGGTVLVYPRPEAELVAARRIADLIRTRVATARRVILGLATGSTPIEVYRHLASFHQADPLPVESVTTYNLDEYYPMSPVDPNSYRSFMDRHLFRCLGLVANQAHVLDGTVPRAYTSQHALDFDRWIAADGGLDLQLLGLGRNGHIGFNEPSDLLASESLALPTRLIDLHPVTRADAIKDFGAEDLVPRQALTVGFATILAARSILILVFGEAKAEAVEQSLTGPITSAVPGSLLQSVAPKVTWLLDPAAASRLF